MANFEEALKITLGHEGGLTDDPDDNGGITNLGLTLDDLARYYKRPGTPDEIRALTVPKASPIYRALYWEPIQGDLIVSQKVADLLFDLGVLDGVGTVVKFVQSIVGVDQDGDLGPITLSAINKTSATKVYMLLIADVLRRYVTIEENDSRQLRFLGGWVNRSADEIERYFS